MALYLCLKLMVFLSLRFLMELGTAASSPRGNADGGCGVDVGASELPGLCMIDEPTRSVGEQG